MIIDEGSKAEMQMKGQALMKHVRFQRNRVNVPLLLLLLFLLSVSSAYR